MDEHGSRSRPSFTELQDYGLPPADDSRWPAFAIFLHNEWFLRTWVLQEVALTKAAWIYKGKYYFPWYNFVWIMYSLIASGAGERLFLPLQPAWLVSQIRGQCSHSQGATLLQLLFMSSLTTTTQAKDKVFALLGFASDKEELRRCLSYTDSPTATFSNVAKFYLSRGCLDVLNFCSDQALRNFQDLPSWTPDWSTSGPTIDLLGRMGRYQDVTPALQPKPIRRLSSIKTDGRLLVVSGNIMSHVMKIGRHISPLRSNIYAMGSKLAGLRLERWRKILESLQSYPTNEGLKEAFAKTLVLGGNQMGDQFHHFMYGYEKWISRLLESSQQNNTATAEAADASVDLYIEKAASACRHRTFFITESGYMGLGPYFTRPSDHIVYLDGGATLYVIRKAKGGSYKIVGDAYVHGLMGLELDVDRMTDINLV